MRPRLPEATRLTRAAFIAAFAIVGFTTCYLILAYTDVPAIVPVRLIHEVPVLHSLKSPVLVMLPVMVQMALAAFIVPLVALLLWHSHSSNDDRAHQGRMRTAAEGVALIGCVWIGVQAVAAVRLVALWERGRGGFGDIYTLALVTAIVLSIVIGTRTAIALAGPGRLVSDDPGVWRLSRLYVDPHNPALFVPARAGRDLTINFGRPVAVIAMATMLGFGVLAPYYVAFHVLKGYWH